MTGSEHHTEYWSKAGITWDYQQPPGQFVGGTYKVSNSSGGYHGLLKQWWDHYFKGHKVLLISESAKVKAEFQADYPNWQIKTTNLTGSDADIVADLCHRNNPFQEQFELIINQATLEHVYNPFLAMENLVHSLEEDGLLLTHTHPPAMPYHPCPKDYFRFMKDWWFDLPKYIEGIELLELSLCGNHDVFSLYRVRGGNDNSGNTNASQV